MWLRRLVWLWLCALTWGYRRPLTRGHGDSLQEVRLTAPVGYLFQYRLATSWRNNPLDIQASSLPDWLIYDRTSATLQGLPLHNDLGHQVTVPVSDAAADLLSSRDLRRLLVHVVPTEDVGLASSLSTTRTSPCPVVADDTYISAYFSRRNSTLARLRLIRIVSEAMDLEPKGVQFTEHRGPIADDVTVNSRLSTNHKSPSNQNASATNTHHVLSGNVPNDDQSYSVLTWKAGCSLEDAKSSWPDQLTRMWSSEDAGDAAGLTRQSPLAWIFHSDLSPEAQQSRAKRQTGDDPTLMDGAPSTVDSAGDYGDYDYDSYDDNYMAVFKTQAPPAQPTTPTPDQTDFTGGPSLGDRYDVDSDDSVESGVAAAGGADGSVSIGQHNYPPYSRQLPRQLVLQAGRPFHWTVPPGAFVDLESGDTRQLLLSLLLGNGDPIDSQHWLQFNSSSQQLYALPQMDNEGLHTYTLRATDPGGLSTSVELKVKVGRYLDWSAASHHLFLEVKPTDLTNFGNQILWQLELVERVTQLVGQLGLGAAVTVHSVLRVADRPVRVALTFGTLNGGGCPQQQLSQLRQLLFTKEGDPSPALKDALAPDFLPRTIRMDLLSSCSGVELQHLPHRLPSTAATSASSTSTEGVGGPSTPSSPQFTLANMPPVVRQPLADVSVTAGQLVEHQIPGDVFVDTEDGDMWSMSVRLLNSLKLEVPVDNWLHLDLQERRLVGLPLAKNVGKEVYYLECTDSGGERESSSFEVAVRPDGGGVNYTAQFNLTLSEDWRAWSRAGGARSSLLMRRVAAALGDSSTRHLLVSDISPGSVRVSWYNVSLTAGVDGSDCPLSQLRRLRAKLRSAATRRLLEPEFRLASADVTPLGPCVGLSLLDEDGKADAAVAGGADAGGDYLLTYVLPALIVAAMLLLAGLIAWMLMRARRRRGKMALSAGSQNGAGSTYVTRGVPVVFADELTELPPPINGTATRRQRQNGDAATPDASTDSDGVTAETPMLSNGSPARGSATMSANSPLAQRAPPPYSPPV